MEQTGVLENPHRPLPLYPFDGHLPGKADELDGLNLVGVLWTVFRRKDTAQHEEEPSFPFGIPKPDPNTVEGGDLVDGYVATRFLQGLAQGSLLDSLSGPDAAGREEEVLRPLSMPNHRETAFGIPHERDNLAIARGLLGFVAIPPVPVDNAPPNPPVFLEEPADLVVRGPLEPDHGSRERTSVKPLPRGRSGPAGNFWPSRAFRTQVRGSGGPCDIHCSPARAPRRIATLQAREGGKDPTRYIYGGVRKAWGPGCHSLVQ